MYLGLWRGTRTPGTLAFLDSSRKQLFAATSWDHLKADGTLLATGYRKARFGLGDGHRPEMAWPRKAYHDEESFGYPFDCGTHRLIRYSFKAEPNTPVLPEYGHARPDEDGRGARLVF
ncbi:unnamed protein product [Peniophora sp. CBMAI 1063]|nr:unnamed protein product [Peniophora sp. CBMAI 1063]